MMMMMMEVMMMKMMVVEGLRTTKTAMTSSAIILPDVMLNANAVSWLLSLPLHID